MSDGDGGACVDPCAVPAAAVARGTDMTTTGDRIVVEYHEVETPITWPGVAVYPGVRAYCFAISARVDDLAAGACGCP